jgi:peptidoglycan-associated lipoprotein
MHLSRNSFRPFPVVLLALAFGSAACADTKPPEAKAPSAASSTAAPPPSDVSATPKQAAEVRISDEIRSKCGIPDEDAYFAFNSAAIRSNDRSPLDSVAQCFTSGPLRGHAVKLVGRADPRGSSDYNMTLGQWRADAVEGYLTSRGMSKSKASSTSRGSMDATGSDEQGWQYDRRVDVILGE